ncbi:MAG: prepilin-type N-terminal cleavage/methylation domain-containing protein [Candidatus Hydrogenedentes bacterium]|nr:prepilin-type N-terminal cleavage/methylation domain-containing protein [Candidatus Hydrogenedentota bacterium]
MTDQYVRRQASGFSLFHSGFTLMEVLVAIVVMGVGITVFISLFGSSLALAQSNRYQTVAAQLAGECLQAVVCAPERYDWHLNPADPGALTVVTAPGESPETRHPVSLPATLPTDRRSNLRDVNLYKQFSWQAYARIPKPDAGYVELTIAIRWIEQGRERVFALTSCVPRTAIPAKPEAAK